MDKISGITQRIQEIQAEIHAAEKTLKEYPNGSLHILSSAKIDMLNETVKRLESQRDFLRLFSYGGMKATLENVLTLTLIIE